ncbi:transcription factor HAC1 [Aspergillus candidus]|uniref:BZIP domain-containing protein n=1 Tax=Aspergillus candidus TaxID=41067 RepID=A0A2I2F5V8_ASPCN|nr:hypothetical protein BDW47DRAFT_119055 [Aspergillus candidus]PLB36034.1 hypothetical protein BDW47DRAFT_119055 [Aspergillus candidus]
MPYSFSPADSVPSSPESEMPLTVSPADTSLLEVDEDEKTDEKKPAKKRKSWGQELPVPKTNLPPRKRAKTDDEKEQRRIERVLRNRAAAQTSRERKRLEMEKLENEKIQMEQQNQFLLQRLNQIEAENNRLNKQVAQLSAEVRGSSRGSTPNRTIASPPSPSPTLTPTLFKQERDELPLDRIPFPTPSSLAHATFSPTLKPSTLDESTDPAQHPAAVLYGSALPLFDLGVGSGSHAADDAAAPLSDDDFHRLFHGDSPADSDPAVLEDGFAFDVLDGGDLSAFPFDSLVDFDSEPVLPLSALDPPHGLPDETARSPARLQPCLGASTS